jgi:hypothetical protein
MSLSLIFWNALVDLLEPAHGRAVESDSLPERILVNEIGGNRQMLQRAKKIDELQIDEFDLLIFDLLENVAGADLVSHSHRRPSLQRASATLAGPDLHDVVELGDKDLAETTTRHRTATDSVDSGFEHGILNVYLDPHAAE